MRHVVCVFALVACEKHHDPDVGIGSAARALFDEVILDSPPGVSDLTLDEHGTIWAIPERDRLVVEIHLSGLQATTQRHELEGVPEGLDTEAITWLGGTKFAFGTEGAQEPTASIRYADLQPDGRFVVTRTRELTSAELGVNLVVNRGVEGICGKGDEILAAIETVGTFPDHTRWAPIVWFHGDTLSVTKLHLTTAVGKISALNCVFAADGTVDVLAIERHYGVSRVLQFQIAAGAEVTPTVVLDLEPVNHDRFNLEGIVKLADGRWVMVNDNQGAHVEGPTELLVFHPR